MRNFAIALIVLALSGVLEGQLLPSVEIFGGYSHLTRTYAVPVGQQAENGWDAAVTGKMFGIFGLTAEVGSVSGSGTVPVGVLVCIGCPQPGLKFRTTTRTFLAGPTFSVSLGRFTPFGHVLVGLAHSKAEFSGFGTNQSDTSFGMAVGGGLDYKLIRGLAWRTAQLDYLMTRNFSEQQNNFRVSTGLVLRF